MEYLLLLHELGIGLFIISRCDAPPANISPPSGRQENRFEDVDRKLLQGLPLRCCMLSVPHVVELGPTTPDNTSKEIGDMKREGHGPCFINGLI